MTLQELEKQLQDPQFDTEVFKALKREIARLQAELVSIAKSTLVRAEVELVNGTKGVYEFYAEETRNFTDYGKFYKYKKDGTISKYSTQLWFEDEIVSFKKL